MPEEVIRRRFRKGIRYFSELYQNLADTWAVYDNTIMGNPGLIAAGAGKEIDIIDKSAWLKFLKGGK